ncbi:MAG: SagB/ThcOx family dehydrogenase [Candidatus Paceibacterota bacterium]|jgi:SagB-type dehydrogenase family enzyme
MRPFLYKFFHRLTKDKTEGGLIKIPADMAMWPESWKIVEYKKISFFDPIKLADNVDTKLFEILQKRTSDRKSLSSNVVTLEKISKILKCACGEIKRKDGSTHRTAPSGGGRYSIELYFLLFKEAEGLKTGVYHYGVENHQLELIEQKNFSEEDILSYQSDKWATVGSGMMCMTSVFDRFARKYGSRGYRYMLLEAGHIGQNILLSGVENDLVFVPIGSSNDVRVESLLKIDGNSESLVYAMSF